MLSSAARAMCPAVVPRVMPTIVPRAYGSQCGAPSPANAGTRYTPPLSGTDAASVRRRRTVAIRPSPSRSHCTTAPPMKTLPSSAYSVRSPIFHATVVIRRLRGRDRPSCRCSAAGSSRCRRCSSPGPATRTSGRRARPADRRRCRRSARSATPRLRRDAAVDLARGAHLGQHARGHAEAAAAARRPSRQRVDVEQHRPRGVADVGDVRAAARQLPHEPGVDGAEGELAGVGALARAGDVVENPGDLASRKNRRRSPARCVRESSASCPSALSRSQTSAVRRSCQTMALWIGCAGLAVPDDRRLALVGDADRGDVAAAAPARGRAPRPRRRSASPRFPAGRARPSRASGRSA